MELQEPFGMAGAKLKGTCAAAPVPSLLHDRQAPIGSRLKLDYDITGSIILLWEAV
jgi:hypothetical protein